MFGLGILSTSTEMRDHNHKEGLFALRTKKNENFEIFQEY